jgi:hypothetical protein
MFASHEVIASVGYAEALKRLADLIHGAGLETASQAAYRDGLTHAIRVGPVPSVTRPVQVRFRDIVTHDDGAVLTLRWEATGPGARLLPVLDADIEIIPAQGDATTLRMVGVYHPPLGSLGTGLDKVILSHVATATIRSFVTTIASTISDLGTPSAVSSG